MAEPKWTPGPWEAYRPPKAKMWIFGAKRPDGKSTLITELDFTGIGSHIQIPNAHLIAAAPDLYDWLQRCLDMVDKGELPPNWDGVRAALSRARGETK